MGKYIPSNLVSDPTPVPVMNAQQMVRALRSRASAHVSVDRSDADVMVHMTRAMRGVPRRDRLAARRRAMGAWDLVVVKPNSPTTVRWAK